MRSRPRCELLEQPSKLTSPHAPLLVVISRASLLTLSLQSSDPSYLSLQSSLFASTLSLSQCLGSRAQHPLVLPRVGVSMRDSKMRYEKNGMRRGTKRERSDSRLPDPTHRSRPTREGSRASSWGSVPNTKTPTGYIGLYSYLCHRPTATRLSWCYHHNRFLALVVQRDIG